MGSGSRRLTGMGTEERGRNRGGRTGEVGGGGAMRNSGLGGMEAQDRQSAGGEGKVVTRRSRKCRRSRKGASGKAWP